MPILRDIRGDGFPKLREGLVDADPACEVLRIARAERRQHLRTDRDETRELGESRVRVGGASADPSRQRTRFAEKTERCEPKPELRQAHPRVGQIVDSQRDQAVERREDAIRNCDEIGPAESAGVERAKLRHLALEDCEPRIARPVTRVESPRLPDEPYRRRQRPRCRVRLRRHELVHHTVGLRQHPVQVEPQPREVGHHPGEDPAVTSRRPRRHVERIRANGSSSATIEPIMRRMGFTRRGAGGSAVSGRACRIHSRPLAKAHSMSCGTPKCPAMERPAAASSARCSEVRRDSSAPASARVPPPSSDGSRSRLAPPGARSGGHARRARCGRA